jgi:hypothetical protein
MERAVDFTHWRLNFLSALELFAQASAQLPFGVSDPVLCGGSAVELYTGSLWTSADLEVVTSDARLLTAELFAVGFRWSERPRGFRRGLWHPELQVGVEINEVNESTSVAEQSNQLIVFLDLAPTPQMGAASLKVTGVEDLIVRQAGCWHMGASASGELATRLQALMGLARQGVGGPLDENYLQRQLGQETQGGVVVEMRRSAAGSAQTKGPRATSLTLMHHRISAWRDQCGLTSKQSSRGHRSKLVGSRTRLACTRNGQGGNEKCSDQPSAEILLFDAAISPPQR